MLEPHIITLESSRRSTLATYAARRERLLRAREDDKEQRRREALRRIAPGFDGDGTTPLEPVRSGPDTHPGSESETSLKRGGGGDVMDDLVDQLERMSYLPTQSTK